jgi:hypothetical protein
MGGMAFEIYQFTFDLFFNTSMFFDSSQTISIDVLTDIRANILGSILGIILIKVYYKKAVKKFTANKKDIQSI